MSSIGREPRSPLAVIADPINEIPIRERDIRLQDYLNDKIQTAADLENLASLISNVESQKKQLEDQLQDAKTKLAKAKKASEDHNTSMAKQIEEFQQHQGSVQERLAIVVSSDTSLETVEHLKGPMEKLRRVELAKAYVELLKDVDTLSKEARQSLPADPKAALRPYTRLKELAIYLRTLQEHAEGAAVHIVEFVEEITRLLWVQMKKTMSDEFQAVLDKINWPSLESVPSREWSDCFGKLLDLQTPELLSAREPVVLLPINVMSRSFVDQFRFHFMGDLPTNDPHKWEVIFEWFLGTVEKREDFFRENVGPVLAAHFIGSKLAGNTLYVDPVSALITALLPILKEKIDEIVIVLSREPQLMSSFMRTLMIFDESVRAKFNYDGGNTEQGWRGLTWEVLDTWFNRWLQIERDFALDRYQEIIMSADSGLIDHDSTGTGKTKATYGATQVTDLLKTLTDQYRRLRRFSHKLRFLIDVQLAILDQYHNRLRDSLDAYLSITSTVGRTLHGVTKEQQAALEGTGGLESLCKVFGSAEYIIITLQEWSYDEFFVELWDQLQDKARVTNTEIHLAGPMSFADIKDVTSASVGSEGDGGALFDETVMAYKRLQKKAEHLIVESIKDAFPTTLRPYLTKPQWVTVGDEPISVVTHGGLTTVTAELDQPLRILRQNMSFLHKTLATPYFKHIWRDCLDTLQEMLWNELLLRETFSTLGAAQLMRDLKSILAVVSSFLAEGSRSYLGMPKLREGVELLNLPLEAGEGTVLISEASNDIFANNKLAKNMLIKLGFTSIDYKDAREILKRRVEISD